jgi:hypothetical protein
MMQNIPQKAAGAVIFAWLCAAPAAWAGDQAKSIVNSLDPKSMNELFEALPTQPDAALTNIVPVGPNKFRFLFIWPGSNPVMTYDRVGRSFTDRFAAFASQLKPLAVGYCIPSQSLYFGTTTYGEDEVNVAYREIEVRYEFGWQPPCQGRYIKAAEIEALAPEQAYHGGYGMAVPAPQPSPALPPAQEQTAPQDGLKPFLNAPAGPAPAE